MGPTTPTAGEPADSPVAPDPPTTGRAAGRGSWRPGRVAGAALSGWAAALVVVVGADGSPGWRVGRAVVVVVVAAATTWLLARRPVAGGVVALACGTVGVAVGLAVGLRTLLVDGPGPVAVAGLVALAAGVALLVVGSHRLLTGRGRWRYLLAPAIGVTVLVASSVLVPALVATNVPPIDPDEGTPADLGLAAEEVTFTTSDGVTLWAWYVPSDDGAAVVLRHGAGSTASDALPEAAVLAEAGYGVLVTDARGHGRSAGRAMDFGWHGDADTVAAVSYLAGRPDVDADRIAVVGLSMGGEEALGAAAADPRIAAVVAEGATARRAEDKAWLPDEYGLRGRAQLVLEEVQYGLTDLLTSASPPRPLAEAAAAAAPRPVLLVTAGSMPDEGHAAEHVRRASPSSVEVWTVPDAPHTGGLATDPAGWERTVVGFLDDALAPR